MKDALEPTQRKGARLARIGVWTAAIGVVLALASGLVVRVGLLSSIAGMGLYAIGSLLLLIALVTAGLGLLRGVGPPRSAVWLGLLAALAIWVNNIVVIGQSRGAPPIHDVSTDLENPPTFVSVVPLRADAPNPPDYAGPDSATQQRAAFPDLGPLRTRQPPATVFAQAREVASAQGWELVAASEPEGRIEATATTGWFRFRDDVVIRISPDDGGTRVDVRSKSRVGRGDMGANARRIRTFLAALEARLAA